MQGTGDAFCTLNHTQTPSSSFRIMDLFLPSASVAVAVLWLHHDLSELLL